MKVFAHRGESALYPENSRSAIASCDSSGMAGVEIDLYQIENEFIVFHDRWLTRVLGIQKRTVDLTRSELNRLLGRDAQPIPTLEWVFETHKTSGLIINLELKEIHDIDWFLTCLKALCSRFQFKLENLLLSSFNHQYLVTIYHQAPEFKIGMILASHPIDAQTSLPPFPIYSVHLDMCCLSRTLISDYKRLGLEVYVFTVDQELEINWLLQANADGIFANAPREASRLINKLAYPVANS